MKFETLRIAGLRCLEGVSLTLAPGINVFTGANGAGKTSVLEAAYLLSHGRSFRSGSRDVLLKRGASALSVFAELRMQDGRLHRLGLGRESGRWQARVDGETAATLGALVQSCAVVCFEPGSHALIAGPSEERRRFLDWGLFHVEHSFLLAWRRYQRALKQRNALLRAGGAPPDNLIAPWEAELAQSGEIIDAQRKAYITALSPHIDALAQTTLPELGALNLRYKRGWDEGMDLAEVLAERRYRDASRGHTTVGPHRADFVVSFEHAPLREHLSRGQEKLCALACLIGQAAHHAEARGEWPVVCLDDLASELDRTHQEWVVAQLLDRDIQVLVTGTEVPHALLSAPKTVFHVEQGNVAGLL
ncbi:DNA replication and repair protein RecF [Luteibacter rhizovicinus]|uniref:DNA replication and repair protein RecF n=1 Tax=Luteibacter rhizovicinus TaxID=242606 RepID=A0A4R3YL42_9GAMM|nr:DNA replication/repair protein RecF [Luteibacter rhizovicinus]TCV92872.1 DNA replication and repair protein RecF [Luteibacter rhizovicinus]